MDETQTHNRQYRATHVNPDLRKAQSYFARGPGLLNMHKNVVKRLHGIKAFLFGNKVGKNRENYFVY